MKLFSGTKALILVLLLAVSSVLSHAQLNMELLGRLSYSQRASDVWGWVDADNTEYALVGTSTGVSVVSLADPKLPVEIAFAAGATSAWRDIKTWGNFAYVLNETGGGLMVIDLSKAPDTVTWTNWSPEIPALGKLSTGHNLYIDEFGYCYLAGTNLNSGGILIIDVFSQPGQPVFVAKAPAVYAHDVYVRNNRMFSSELYKGAMAIYDVSDKQSIKLVASQGTPNSFTHNIWINDAGTVAFTTDEKANAPVTAFDISNPSQIVELDQFRPLATLGAGVIPHNVHVKNDWLVISYYTDGAIIVDASRPSNLIEVGNWDTYPNQGAGFNGAWGVYPFLPSGLVLISDITNGLFVCKANYLRACWLEGIVTNSASKKPILGAGVNIQSNQVNLANSGVNGLYETGQAASGIFEVVFSAKGYYSKTVTATLVNGVLTILNVSLDPLPLVSLSGQTNSKESAVVPFSQIIMVHSQGQFSTTSDAAGNFKFNSIYAGNYSVYAGAWGYQPSLIENFVADGKINQTVDISLDKGYRDDFLFDFNWTAKQNSSTGWWLRGKPIGTFFNDQLCNPDADVAHDYGDKCFMTGNSGGSASTDDVDNGVVTLISPPMDLTSYNLPALQYDYWFFNEGGNEKPNDTLLVFLSNGADTILLDSKTLSGSNWRASEPITLIGLMKITDNMRVIFQTEDKPDSDHLLEAAIDAFSIIDAANYPQFTASKTEGCAPFVVQFTDISDTTSVYNWKFEGGVPASSNLRNPTVTYSKAGNYKVELEVITTNGLNLRFNKAAFIKAESPPIPSFTFAIQNNQVSFLNSSAIPAAYTWNFGDGKTSQLPNPVHSYETDGAYQVELAVSNSCGTVISSQSLQIGLSSATENEKAGYKLTVWPNPYSGELNVSYELSQASGKANLRILNQLGQQVELVELRSNAGSISLGNNWNNGSFYWLVLQLDGKMERVVSVLKK